MVDTKTKSAAMRAVKSANTAPELIVRKALHAAGYRFRLHRADLPGKPDIVLPKYRTCVFVNGCFWHQHRGCKKAKRPSSNMDFWDQKLDRNVERDKENVRALEGLGWRVLVVWECEASQVSDIIYKIARLSQDS